jgi:hypothetical protein
LRRGESREKRADVDEHPVTFKGEVLSLRYLGNAFSLGMLKASGVLGVRKPSLEQVKEELSEGFESVVGHESTAKLLSKLLGVEVPVNRATIKLNVGDELIVFQLLTRLPEGAILTEEELSKLDYTFYVVSVLRYAE